MVELETSYAFRCYLVLKARTAKKRYDTSCRTCMVFQARAMRGTRAECANVLAHSICKFQGTDRKHEMRHELSELKGVVIVNVFK